MGPDGALWFTEYDGNKIGRITTAGAVTEFPIPTAGSQPSAMTVGPDGALWFIEDHGSSTLSDEFYTWLVAETSKTLRKYM